jgi:serpin B
MMRSAAAGLLAIALATLGDINAVRATSPVYGPQQAAWADNKLGFGLLHAVTKGWRSNVVLSPVSAGLDLAMVYNGARGPTAAEMAKALAVADAPMASVNHANTGLITMLRSPLKQVALEVANSLFTDKRRLALDTGFAARVAKTYDAEISELDFSKHASVDAVNGWASKQTKGKIKKVIDEIAPGDLLFLINAVYFKGQWTTKFDKKLTTEKDFTLADGSLKKVPMMAQSGEFRYVETPDFQAIALPYGDGTTRMLVFLPAKTSNLGALIQKMDFDRWTDWTGKFERKNGHIELPRFTVEYTTLLNSALRDLGMRRAFDPRTADLGAMFAAGKAHPNPYIGFVKQDTYLRVDEEGSEAAATTTTGIRMTAIRVETQPFSMIVDRPFACAIEDTRTGALLFVGAIYKP